MPFFFPFEKSRPTAVFQRTHNTSFVVTECNVQDTVRRAVDVAGEQDIAKITTS